MTYLKTGDWQMHVNGGQGTFEPDGTYRDRAGDLPLAKGTVERFASALKTSVSPGVHSRTRQDSPMGRASRSFYSVRRFCQVRRVSSTSIGPVRSSIVPCTRFGANGTLGANPQVA